MAGYGIWMALLIAAYYLLPSLRLLAWSTIGFSAVLAMAVGVLINRPGRRMPWLLLAGANLSFAATALTFLIFTRILHESVPFPSIADVFHLAAYPLYAAGFGVFVRRRIAGRDRRSLLDALTLTVGLGLLSWIYLILPYAQNPGLSQAQKAFAIAYPLGDVLVLAMLARLLASGSRHTRSVELLTIGTAAMLLADVSVGLRHQLYGSFHAGTVAGLGWAIFSAASGTATLHPSMAELTRPVSRQQEENSPLRLCLLTFASLIAPGVLFVEAVHGAPRDGGVIAVFSAILYLLVLSHLCAVAVSHRRALGRERALQVAGASLERVMLSQEVNRRGSEAYFRTLIQDTSDVIFIINNDDKIRYATPSAKTIFGNVNVDGAYLWDLVKPNERDDVIRAMSRMRHGSGQHSFEDWRIMRNDGTGVVEVEVRCSDLRRDPTVHGLVLTLTDVTERRQLERELKHRAFHDSLTGLPNRVLFQDRTVHALARARRTSMIVGVLFVDLDDFKVVNDTMGHSVGDDLLVAAAMRLSKVTREADTTARLGGDEFALLVEDVGDSAAVELFAEHIVRAFHEPFTLADGSMITTATVGVATTEDSADAGELIRHADLALYAAKAAGKRQWRRYQPVLSAGMIRRRELQAALDDAVANAEFTLVYQPIVALASGEVAGFEALVRWVHPRWGMILPDQFIALAEETGQIVPLGRWVLERAAADTVQWQHRVPRQPPLYVSVNVSARQFTDSGFTDGVRQVLETCGLAPSALLLELTESVLLRRDYQLRADLKELKSIGVKLAIDDFGTGYSSLSYLRELPIEVIKIDKSFVEGIAACEQHLALAEVIIRIAKTLGLTVMAEGIENEIQRELLISMGCEFGQGYLLARPMEADEAEALLRAGRSLVPELPQTSHLWPVSHSPSRPAPEGTRAARVGAIYRGGQVLSSTATPAPTSANAQIRPRLNQALRKMARPSTSYTSSAIAPHVKIIAPTWTARAATPVIKTCSTPRCRLSALTCSSSGKANTGSSIRPAPCADDITNDQQASCQRDSRMPTQRTCRELISCHSPNTSRMAPPPITTTFEANSELVMVSTITMTAMAPSCPKAMKGSASRSARLLRSCRPNETANSQPMPGSTPWKTPSTASVTSCAPVKENRWSRVAVGVARGVTALQPDLVNPAAAEHVSFGEEPLVERDPAVGRAGIELGHPRADSLRVELVVPRAVQGVRHIHAPSVTADLDHLRPAAQRNARFGRVRGLSGDAAEPHRSGLPWVERIADVVLLELPRPPAGHVEETVVNRKIDVGDQRRHGSKSLQQRRQFLGGGGFRGNGDDLGGCPPAAVLVPQPDRRRQILHADYHADEAVLLCRVVRRAQFEDHLILVAEINSLDVLAAAQIPEMQLVAVLAAEQEIWDQAIFDHGWCRPFRGDRDIVSDVPPDVVGEILIAPVNFEAAEHFKGRVIEQRDPARAVFTVPAAQTRHVKALGTAVHGMRP